MPAPHPREFRRRTVELARQNTAPIAQVAKDLGISESCLRNWKAPPGKRIVVTQVLKVPEHMDPAQADPEPDLP